VTQNKLDVCLTPVLRGGAGEELLFFFSYLALLADRVGSGPGADEIPRHLRNSRSRGLSEATTLRSSRLSTHRLRSTTDLPRRRRHLSVRDASTTSSTPKGETYSKAGSGATRKRCKSPTTQARALRSSSGSASSSDKSTLTPKPNAPSGTSSTQTPTATYGPSTSRSPFALTSTSTTSHLDSKVSAGRTRKSSASFATASNSTPTP